MLAKKPLTVQDRIFLGRSQCGYTDKPWVCCLPESEWEDVPAPTTPAPTQQPIGERSLLPVPGSGKCGLGYEVSLIMLFYVSN